MMTKPAGGTSILIAKPFRGSAAAREPTLVWSVE